MEIRQSTMEDLPVLMELYADAREFMREHGNESQWGDTYPPEELVREDIRSGISYVCIQEEILACFVFYIGDEPDYREMTEGSWPDDRPYAVVHRITTRKSTHGVARFCLDWVSEQHSPVRMDTHRNNVPMQNLLRKCGFEYCGTIRLQADGSFRDAFIRT